MGSQHAGKRRSNEANEDGSKRRKSEEQSMDKSNMVHLTEFGLIGMMQEDGMDDLMREGKIRQCQHMGYE